MAVAILSLEALLETHELPFIIYNNELRIVAVNKAWELMHGLSKDQILGRMCCEDLSNCRHKQLLSSLESYRETVSENDQQGNSQLYNVKGLPLIGYENKIYLSESKVLCTHMADHNTTLVGRSRVFVECLQRMKQAANTDLPVMLHGETGTGKEMVAEFVHNNSLRKSENFVIVDCTILSEQLFESELFGHEKGSFTGANAQKKGLFEIANNGTLFLDEIGELPLSQQAKLLRALETGQFRRVGGAVMHNANVRVIAATHRNLAEMVRKGQFREDLFYRLSIFPVNLPPLRDRVEDIPMLAIHFLSQFGQQGGKFISISPSALDKLKNHHWPGNVRELKNCTYLACGLSQNGLVEEHHIQFMRPIMQVEAIQFNEPSVLTETRSFNIDDQEREYINYLLKKHENHRKACAEEMNITERTFYRKLKKHNIS